MREPEYDVGLVTLLIHKGLYALFASRVLSSQGSISKYVEGDWEFYDSGDLDDMRTKFDRLTALDQFGVNLDTFDKAYPHDRWEEIDGFTGPMEISYTLWKERTRSIDPRAFTSTASKEGEEIHWRIVDQGKLSAVKEVFARSRFALEVKDDIPIPAPINEYAAHPNFGRF
ncbi:MULTISPECIES: hypothetical protein [unclassified Ensifer]|uniref:hypothetical protein n=1 Tax=unclassified Ensifer TaxID=2633371 RepID=UPI000813849E|nr:MULTISPECIES: hypothetical protein [unclassified Ensifer]OCP21953.1 hypothetical protein BC361_25630 [Ensifer sp. LC54]OCP23267.1 hypothetical protein BC363_25135 [Ensifer sp. LC384]